MRLSLTIASPHEILLLLLMVVVFLPRASVAPPSAAMAFPRDDYSCSTFSLSSSVGVATIPSAQRR